MKTRTNGRSSPFSTWDRKRTGKSGTPGNQDDAGADHDHAGVERVELRRLAPRLVHAGLEAEPLADGVGRGERQDGGREERGVREPEGEERLRPLSRERLQRDRGLLGAFDADPLREERRAAGDDDEERDDGREQASRR